MQSKIPLAMMKSQTYGKQQRLKMMIHKSEITERNTLFNKKPLSQIHSPPLQQHKYIPIEQMQKSQSSLNKQSPQQNVSGELKRLKQAKNEAEKLREQVDEINMKKTNISLTQIEQKQLLKLQFQEQQRKRQIQNQIQYVERRIDKQQKRNEFEILKEQEQERLRKQIMQVQHDQFNLKFNLKPNWKMM
ncbi:Hypothetical_protein [Hexamita inflata]|uniref:Hypothetical_protein n=1 Tax=Hexamita inflata TaxID=28002 RepID=A0AA86TT79_9EUKA|nr:Hypothetical protein HINF_LOCUS13577 [Hexamita inflata]